MFKHRLMLSAAATALLAGSALAANPTTITTATTTALKTSTANSGAPDNIQINSGGSVTINATGAAITIDSSNWVNSGGVISNKDHDGARGIVLDATGGPITVSGTPIFSNGGTIDLTGSGTGKSAIAFTSGTYNGDIFLAANSIIKVTGDNSSAILTAPGSILNGKMTVDGTITVSSTSASSLTTSNIIGIDLGGIINGDLSINGSTTVIGAGAQGVVLTSAGSITGTFSNLGTIFSTGVLSPNAKTVNPEASSAVIINGSLGGGFYNSGPVNSSDITTTPALISMAGQGAAVLITPAATTLLGDITLGVVPVGIDGSNGGLYGFINHGSILASPVDPNLPGTGGIIGLWIGNNTAYKTIVTGGLLNTGSITASYSSTDNGAVPAAAGSTIGMFLGSGADVQKVVNQQYGSRSARIGASVSGPGGGTATGLLIGSTAIPTGTLEIDNLDGASIFANATTTDPSVTTALNGIAIIDLSGKLTLIRNSGTISAFATALENGAQNAVAIDVQANSTGVTITDGYLGGGGNIIGAIKLGTGADTVNVTGVSPTVTSSIAGDLLFGTAGAGVDTLTVGSFASVSGALVSGDSNLIVTVANNAFLSVNNTLRSTAATPVPTLLRGLDVANLGTFNVTIAQSLHNGVIVANDHINLASGSLFNVNFGSFINATGNFVILDAPLNALNIPDASSYVSNFKTPFLFTGGICTNNVAVAQGGGAGIDCTGSGLSSSRSQLILTLNLKPLGSNSATQLPLTGYPTTPVPALGAGKTFYDLVNTILPLDSQLGSAVVSGVTLDTSLPPAQQIPSAIAEAQQVYDAFAPQVTGGSRQIAVAITDQSSGPVGARQRALRMYGKQPGESTLWGVEYAEFLKDPGETIAATGGFPAGLKPGFKDHGFGFSLGADGGSANDGWYGGALTFFTGDIGEVGDRSGQSQSEWYMLTGYTDWRGRGLFLDSNLNVGVVQFKGKRNLVIDGSTIRTATSHHIGTYLAGGFTTGAIMKFAGTTITPQLSFDGLTLRENGYTESGGGSTTPGEDGFDLAVGASYSNSLRSFFGVDLRQDIDLGSFFLQPSARVGYRYDFVGAAQKVNAHFLALQGTSFSMTGPDPTQGNLVANASLAASTDTWSMGVSFDWIRGQNGETQEAGQFTLVGRI